MAHAVLRRRGLGLDGVDRALDHAGVAGFRTTEGRGNGAQQSAAPHADARRMGIARGFAISALGSITYYVGIT